MLSSIDSYAQEEEIRYSPGKRKFNAGVVPQVGQTQNNGQQSDNTGADSMGFKRRDDSKDRVLVTYRYLDSSTRHSLDSSVNNFDTYFSIPSNYQYLGNNGSAAFPLVFTPVYQTGGLFRRGKDTKIFIKAKFFLRFRLTFVLCRKRLAIHLPGSK